MIQLEWLNEAAHYLFAVLVVAIIVFYIYEHFNPPQEQDNYDEFSRELRQDMNRYGIDLRDQQQLERLVDKMIEKKKQEKSLKKIMHACKVGLVRGCIVGFVSGGVPGAIASGTTYGIVNGIMNGVFGQS